MWTGNRSVTWLDMKGAFRDRCTEIHQYATSCLKIMENFQENVPQCKIVKTLKKERNHPAKFSYQWMVEHPASLMVCGCISVYGGQLPHLERLHQCWREHRGFRGTSAPIHTTSLSGKTLNNLIHPEKSPAAELTCLQSRSFISRKLLAHDKMTNLATKVQDCWAAASDTNGTKFLS